ncbi:MAG: hypothetical protein AAGI07_09850 [Bacteroidota bacterium]
MICLYSCCFLFIIILSCKPDKAKKQVTDNVVPELISASGFPKNWIGCWKGNIKIDNLEKDTVIQIPMSLNISTTERSGKWNWQLVYNDSPRDYELIAFDTPNGHFKLDEKNTIVLDQQLFDNVFISRYDVAGNLLMVTNRLIGKEMLFEVIFSRSDTVNTSGGKGEVPLVKSYPISVYQRAVLNKE